MHPLIVVYMSTLSTRTSCVLCDSCTHGYYSQHMAHGIKPVFLLVVLLAFGFSDCV